jgi:DNA-binding response OmpR family regulator
MMPKILVVDDEAPIRRLLQMTFEDFEDQGVEILVAKNGQDALAIIEQEKPDLVCLDVMLPGMNGFEVCDTVKNKLGLTDVTIILLTAKGQEVDRLMGEKVGADLYITKPFDPDVLLKLVSEILGLDMG